MIFYLFFSMRNFFSHKKLFRGIQLPLLFEKHHKHFLCYFMRKVINSTLLCRKFYMCDSCDSPTPDWRKTVHFTPFSAGLPRTGQRPLPAWRYPLRADLHSARWPSRVTALPPTQRLGSAQQSQRSAPLYEVRELVMWWQVCSITSTRQC